MIVRIWHGRVPAARKQAYIDYLHQTGLKDYAATPGNRGVDLLCRDMGQLTEFLTEMEPFVKHYEVVFSRQPA